MHKKKIVIFIDGHTYLYKLYYGQKNNKYFQQSKMIYNLLYILKKILLKYKPVKLIIIFDNKNKNFRNQLFTEYKKNRSPMPQTLQLTIPIIYNVLINIGIPIIDIPNVEADDVIGTLSKIEEKKGYFILIATSDKDFSQLVNKNINILNNINNKILNAYEIQKKYGVPPQLIVDFLSLTGDATDNIPGVKGIGKKIAAKLLNNIGSIKNIYNNFYKINYLFIKKTNHIIKKLQQGKENAFLSYKLVKIKLDVHINKKDYGFKLFHPCQLCNINYIHVIYNIKNIIYNNLYTIHDI